MKRIAIFQVATHVNRVTLNATTPNASLVDGTAIMKMIAVITVTKLIVCYVTARSQSFVAMMDVVLEVRTVQPMVGLWSNLSVTPLAQLLT